MRLLNSSKKTCAEKTKMAASKESQSKRSSEEVREEEAGLARKRSKCGEESETMCVDSLRILLLPLTDEKPSVMEKGYGTVAVTLLFKCVADVKAFRKKVHNGNINQVYRAMEAYYNDDKHTPGEVRAGAKLLEDELAVPKLAEYTARVVSIPYCLSADVSHVYVFNHSSLSLSQNE